MEANNKMETPSRRKLLLGALALGAGPLLGCAASPTGPGLGRVVVVGAGFGGATAARYLKLWGGNIEVTLVDRNPAFVSCPLSNLVLGGHRQMADITRDYAGLDALGVRRIQAEVAAIDADARQVRLADGTRLTYDRLVLSPGVDFMADTVDGLRPALDSGQVLHAWKAGPQTLALRRRLEALPDGGVVAMTVPKAPYRCPPGPYERACMIASYLKQAKPRAKLLVLDANPEIQSKKALFERAFKTHYADQLEYRPNAELKELAEGGRLARLEFEDVRADLFNVIPPQRAADLALAAGVVNVNQRWAAVNWLTLESTAVPGLHVLGDALFPGPGMPKSGHMANQQAKLAAAAIIQLLKGEAVNPTPVLMNTCYSFVTAQDVIHVASVHQYDAAERGFKPVAGAGGVSESASALEGRYAQSWAYNIWDDMLGGKT